MAAVICREKFPVTPVLLGLYGVRYYPVDATGTDLIVLQDVHKLLGHTDNVKIYEICRKRVGTPVRLEETSTQSCVGATPMKDLIHVLENFIGGAAATAIATQMRQWGKRVPAPPIKLQTYAEKLPDVIPAPTNLSIAGISIKQDSEGRYCLNDLFQASGGLSKHQPGNWLRNKQTRELIEEINSIPQIRGIESKQGYGTFVCKELVYHYAMWISPAFSLKVIRAYDALVTGQFTPPVSKDDQLLLVQSFELQKRLSARLDVLQIENKGLEEEVQEVKVKLDKMKVFTLQQVVNYLNTLGYCTTADALSNALALYGYLTPMRRVPARKQWAKRWFRFGLVDVINQDEDLVSSSGEEFFITETGLEGIKGLLESMDWWERHRLDLELPVF